MGTLKNNLAAMSKKIQNGAKIYVWYENSEWERLAKEFRVLHNESIFDSVDGFIVDNDQASISNGKLEISSNDLKMLDRTDTVILIMSKKEHIPSLLMQAGYCDHLDFFPLWRMNSMKTTSLFQRYEREVKGKHIGERCFIIGNGKSLSISDLNLLSKEVTFAVNYINIAFSETSWRPTYYVTQDYIAMCDVDVISQRMPLTKLFLNMDHITIETDFIPNTLYFSLDNTEAFLFPYPHNKPSFSKMPLKIIQGHTVLYTCFQIAAYMGFSEIYLLGVDNDFAIMRTYDGNLIVNGKKNHFSDEYEQLISNTNYIPDIDSLNKTYEAAYEYFEANNITVMNATKGGKLDVFPRIDFDSLVKR
jgi:hypothetical protein